MKVLVTGVSGQLGYDVIKALDAKGIDYIGCGPDDFDLRNEEATLSYLKNHHPDVVIHCAAYTAVDKAEDEKDICMDVNAKGTEYIAKACQALDAKLVFISTDYVFDGNKETPYEVNDERKPINTYGLSKQMAEDIVSKVKKHFIVRTSWVYGINGHNFVKTMIRLGIEKEIVSVVSDQVGSPTYTPDLANFLVSLIETEKYGIYHATNEGYCSWFDFASQIMKEANLNCVVKPIYSQDYPTKARRPQNSRLSKKKLVDEGFNQLPSWQDALKRYFLELNKKEESR